MAAHGPDDFLIEQAKAFFQRQSDQFDGFEVWDGKRRLHVYPEVIDEPNSS
jgi:hypothetical protein